MKKVIVHPERCVGCMQCMFACAVAHSANKATLAALFESPVPRPRVHVGAGLYREGFPNRCRHCEPAPCMLACLPGAIYRDEKTDSVLVDSDVCINCASCAMACPFGVIRYHQDRAAFPGKAIAVKCDNCVERQAEGLIPACVEACKSGALTFEESDAAMKRRTDEVACRFSLGIEKEAPAESASFTLLNSFKRAQQELETRAACKTESSKETKP